MNTTRKKIYERVVDFIKTAIFNGEMKLGDAIYSENYLCEKLQVSRTSVRRAIRLMVEENILVSQPGVGTFVKAPGQGTIHNNICLLNHYTRVLRYNMADSYYMDLIYGAESAAGDLGVNFQIFSKPIVNETVEVTKHLKTDGIIVDGFFQNYYDNLEFLTKISPNLVVLDGNPEESVFPVIAPDLESSFQELAELALTHGNNALFLYSNYVSFQRWSKSCFERIAAQIPELQVNFIDFSANIPRHLYYNIDHQYLIRKVLVPLLNEKVPDCIICSSDHTAGHLLRVLPFLSLRVPEDVAVAGMRGLVYSTMTKPALTTVMVSPTVLAETAVKRLMALIKGEKWDSGPLVKTTLQRRESL